MTDQQLALLKMPELEKLETRVTKGLASFMDVGHALMEIQDKRGYLLRGHKTMEEYCDKQFHFSLRQGQRLMVAAQTATKVEKIVGEAPRNEASARVLNPIANEPKLVEKVAAQLKKQGATIATATAEKLQEVVDKIKPQTKPMFEEPKPKPSTNIPTLSDVCPTCGHAPNNYLRSEVDGWVCGQCNTRVLIGVVAANAATCNDCGAPLLDDSGICRKCGCVQ